MTFFRTVWNKLKRKSYREEFIASQARRSFPFQVRAIMRKRGISQLKLAEASGLTQGVVSRASNPAYGRLTLNTIIRIAIGLDMAVLIRLVPFSRLVRDNERLSEAELADVATFDEDDAKAERVPVPADLLTETRIPSQVGGTTTAPEKLAQRLLTSSGRLRARFSRL